MSTEFIEGQALVASPFLTDRNFHRSVVYIVKHDTLGAYGLILNRPLNVLVSELLRQVTDENVDIDEPIYHGGLSKARSLWCTSDLLTVRLCTSLACT